MSSSSELQRDREVQGYLQSWQVAQGSSLKVARNLDNIVASHHPLGELPGHTPQASSDKALSAFAQLAVLRLNAQNALISLIDASTQTVLAEATRNLRLGDLDGGAKNDLFLGTSILSRGMGPCEHALTETCTARDPDGETYTTAGMIVPDCRLDPRFQTRPFVQADGGLRFYAGVPIFSRKGHKIGTYAVCSDEPRDGLSIDDLQFIQNVAQAVMEHLEWARDRVDRFKGERIVRGLACFIEGCSGDDPTCAKNDQATGPPVVRPPAINITSPRRPLLRRISSTKLDAGGPRPASPGGQQKQDRLTRMFFRAADTLRSSTLADGVVIFGATASNVRQRCRAGKPNGLLSDEDDQSPHITSGSDGFGIDSSDSDTSPAARPCKILSYSLADEKVHAEIEKGPALSLGTLEKYFSLFPKGKTFSFTDEGLGISSDDDSASDREPTAGSENPGERGKRRRGAKMDHKELLKKIPGAKSVVFLPLFDHVEDKLAGGCFLWTSITGQMMNLDQDLSYLRAFGNSVMSEVGRINTQKNEAAKTTFIASMSHELRSPLHGILGAAEFLKDTITDSYQAGLVNSVLTCGKTLLDTLNHVLDYSKINTLGRSQMRRGGKHSRLISLSSGSLESLNMSAAVDLSVLVEEVVNAISTGHTFKRLPGIYSPSAEEPTLADSQTLKHLQPSDNGSPVSVLLDICPRTSWMVSTQPGALRRVIMNLFGNALKYTSSGFILVSLRGQETSDKSKIDVVIKVTDTGKGMSEEFQQNRLFVPFSQEDSFQPGTGLGLSIVKQIVDSLKGTLEVKSQQHKGTEVDVCLRLVPAPPNSSRNQDETARGIVEKTRGRRLVLLGSGERNLSPSMALQIRMRNETLIETCTNWFEMEVVKEEDGDASNADIYLYCEPPSIQSLKDRFESQHDIPTRSRKTPIAIICAGEEEAAQIARTQTKALAELSKIIEVVPQPCGPRKLAQVFKRCLQRIEEIAESESAQDSLPSPPQEPPVNGAKVEIVEAVPAKPAAEDEGDLTPVPSETTLPLPSPMPLDPETPLLAGDGGQLEQNDEEQETECNSTHVLLVDDNKINLQLLVMFMKKCKFTYEEAENGQEALDKFTSRNLTSKKRFDYILMDISMPVMNGIEATKRIRQVERENQIQPTTVLALTGLASADARRDVLSAGVDVFLPKPVRFAELKKLLTDG
ncbi:hypothetical protein CDV36_005079 [Fusarium kuroshium]|uniref:histidine kinase n=1 Tax=Fusarium kuroshium TaxID=2010991 RepID=A0A3M2SCN9_9HYPO|nr:hypothetical protein CDV36_005079 [Fusarium kuroshium]